MSHTDQRDGTTTVVVVPFRSLAIGKDGHRDQAASTISSELSSYRSLRVIDERATAHRRGTSVDVRSVARDTGARYLLSGSVVARGGKEHTFVQLIGAHSCTSVWSCGSEGVDDPRAFARSVAVQVCAALTTEPATTLRACSAA